MNKTFLIGRLGKDVDLTKSKNGTLSIASFSIATSANYTKDGQKVEKTEWHRLKAFGPLADVCAKYLAKGRQVSIEGRNETSTYEDKEGIKRYSTEVIVEKVEFLGTAPSKGASTQAAITVADDEPVTFTEGDEPNPASVGNEPAPF